MPRGCNLFGPVTSLLLTFEYPTDSRSVTNLFKSIVNLFRNILYRLEIYSIAIVNKFNILSIRNQPVANGNNFFSKLGTD